MAIEKATTGRGRGEAGFSVLELVIALAVVTIVLVVIPFSTAFSPESEINGATSAMADDLRWARSQAIKSGNDVEVAIDVNAGVVNIYNDANNNGPNTWEIMRSRALVKYGAGIFRNVVGTGIDGKSITQPVAMGSTSNPYTVTFHANGSATNSGVIYLGHKRNSNLDLGRAISILGTGNIQTWKYNAYGSPGPWKRWI